jgi:hypothetical protein
VLLCAWKFLGILKDAEERHEKDTWAATELIHKRLHYEADKAANLTRCVGNVLGFDVGDLSVEDKNHAEVSFVARMEEAVFSCLLGTVALSEETMTVPCDLQDLLDDEEDTLYYVAGWLVRRLRIDMVDRKQYRKFEPLVGNWTYHPCEALCEDMAVSTVDAKSKGAWCAVFRFLI